MLRRGGGSGGALSGPKVLQWRWAVGHFLDYDGDRVSTRVGTWRLQLADSLSSAWDLLDAEALTAANSGRALLRALGAFRRA
jgi:hypothetical protein